MGETLLKQHQAAEYLSVTPRALESWRRLKQGPAFVRVGQQVRYRAADLEAWLDENTVRPAS